MVKGDVITLFDQDLKYPKFAELEELQLIHFNIPAEDIFSAQVIRYVSYSLNKVVTLKDRYVYMLQVQLGEKTVCKW